jgi:hypothetical protein
MAGLVPGICNTQNVDANGKPYAHCKLTVYDGGTLTLSDVFQDIGLATAAANPMTADLTGRLPIFYVADGTYRVILNAADGTKIYDYPQVAAIGASSSGGGGSAVDAATIFQTGDSLWLDASGARTGWVRNNGRTIGSATSGASERANSDCEQLFLFGWAAGWAVVGGAGLTAAADWTANKQITIPDWRGYTPIGLDDMGNSAAGRFSGVTFTSGDEITSGSLCGENAKALIKAELPNTTFAVLITAGQGSHAHGPSGASTFLCGFVGGTNASPGGGSALTFTTSTTSATLPAMTGTAASGGSGTALSRTQRSVTCTAYRKL